MIPILQMSHLSYIALMEICIRVYGHGNHSATNHTCQKHAPANNGNEEVGRLGHKLEWPVQVKESEDVLQPRDNSSLRDLYPKKQVACSNCESRPHDERSCLTEIYMQHLVVKFEGYSAERSFTQARPSLMHCLHCTMVAFALHINSLGRSGRTEE